MKKTIFALFAAFAASMAIAAPADTNAIVVDTAISNAYVNSAGDVAQASGTPVALQTSCVVPECDQW